MKKIWAVVTCLLILSVPNLSACHPVVTLQGRLEDLETEVIHRPIVQPIKANVSFRAENGQEILIKGYTSETSHFDLVYPAKNMLQQAGEVSIKRWFMPRASDQQRAIDISAKIEHMYYNDVTDVWNKVKALVAIKVHVHAVAGQEVLLDKVYDSGKQYGDYFKIGLRLGVGEQYETHYSRTAYKALLIALDQAMQDIIVSAQQKGMAP
jgi:hypothetical protein